MLALQGCSGDEREMGKMVADIISKTEKPVIAEGQEPPEFWMALGGKSQYANSKRYQPCARRSLVPAHPQRCDGAPVPKQGESCFHHHHCVALCQAAGREPLCDPSSL